MRTLKELMIEELVAQAECQPITKDILIVVRNQFNYVQECIESVYSNTAAFNLYVWDNGSDAETADFLADMAHRHSNLTLYRADENQGFIIPNNTMAAATTSPYIVLLNSDTVVSSGWDSAMLGYLQKHPEVGIVGYEGGLLSNRGMGVMPWKGPEVDYIMAWCLAMPRWAYEKLGLFDGDHLQFAYCEDADLCLRAKEADVGIYALNTDFVLHHANVTARKVGREMDLSGHFLANHKYAYARHKNYIEKGRVLLNYPDVDFSISEDARKTPEAVAADFNKY